MPEEKINREIPSHMIENLIQRITIIENVLFAGKEVLTLEEAAVFMGVSRSTLYKMTHNNVLPFYRPNGKLIFFEKSVLLEWMRKNQVLSKEQIEATAQQMLHELAMK